MTGSEDAPGCTRGVRTPILIHYGCFIDLSGGTRDSMAAATGHREGERAVLDVVREVRPPFSPDEAVTELVERRSAVLETVVGGAFGRRERLSALDAPVAPPFPGRGSVESTAADVAGLDVSVQRTREIETPQFLHVVWALVDDSTVALQ